MPVTLDQILTSTRDQLPELRRRRAALESEARAASPPPSFAGALRRKTVAVIAEVKRRSPSAGTIRDDLDPGERAFRYGRQGAAAISVLTDGPYFGGSVADLRTAVARAGVPVLRKDFILDELQILEARAAGAAAVLLIVRALEGTHLEALFACVREYGLDALVEVHTSAELERALAVGARILGINSRDLDLFTIDTTAAWRIVQAVPADRIAVAESGMTCVADVERAAAAGADAVLIGTALSAAADPDRLLAGLSGVPRRAR